MSDPLYPKKILPFNIWLIKVYMVISLVILITNIHFLILFSGESGLGKSTLLNSLFLTDLYTAATFPTTEEKLAKTTEVIFPIGYECAQFM